MPNYKTIHLYNKEIIIKFDEDNHRYWRFDGDGKMKRLSGVTTFLNIINKPALIPWAVGVTIQYVREHLDSLQEDPKTLLQRARDEHTKQRDIAAEIGSAIQ